MPASHFICVIIRPYFTDDHSLEMSSWRLLSLFIPTRAQSAPYSWKWDLMGGWVCGWLCSWYVTGWPVFVSDLISLTASSLAMCITGTFAIRPQGGDKCCSLRYREWQVFPFKEIWLADLFIKVSMLCTWTNNCGSHKYLSSCCFFCFCQRHVIIFLIQITRSTFLHIHNDYPNPL